MIYHIRLACTLLICATLGFVLSGCTPLEKNLSFDLSKNTVVPLETKAGTRHLSVKTVDNNDIGIGAFIYNADDYSGLIDVMGVIVKITNTTSKELPLHPADISIQTSGGYYLQQVDIEFYSKELYRYSRARLKEAKRLKVRDDYEVEYKSLEASVREHASITPNTIHTVPITPHNPISYDIYESYRDSQYGYGYTITPETQDRELKHKVSKTYITRKPNREDEHNKRMAMSHAETLQTIALKFRNEFVPRILDKPVTIRPYSWNYFYLFFEKPMEYPVQIVYKDTIFELVP